MENMLNEKITCEEQLSETKSENQSKELSNEREKMDDEYNIGKHLKDICTVVSRSLLIDLDKTEANGENQSKELGKEHEKVDEEYTINKLLGDVCTVVSHSLLELDKIRELPHTTYEIPIYDIEDIDETSETPPLEYLPGINDGPNVAGNYDGGLALLQMAAHLPVEENFQIVIAPENQEGYHGKRDYIEVITLD